MLGYAASETIKEWTGCGAMGLGVVQVVGLGWLMTVNGRGRCRTPEAPRGSSGIQNALAVAFLMMAFWGLRGGTTAGLGRECQVLWQVGTWLAHLWGPNRVMTMYAQLPYYSRGILLLMA